MPTHLLPNKQRFLDLLLIAEALPALAISRCLILLLPFRQIASLMGEINQEAPYAQTDQQVTTRIGTILRWQSRYLPWRSMCFEQAVAGMLMLKRRGIDCTIYFGVRNQSQAIKAHAWLRSGEQIITGAAGYESFTVLFSVTSTPKAKSKQIRNNIHTGTRS